MDMKSRRLNMSPKYPVYSFYRPEELKLAEWLNISEKLRFDALQFFKVPHFPDSQKRYALSLLRDLRPARRDGYMLILDLGEELCRNEQERFSFVCVPSYFAAGILLNTALRCPRLLEDEITEQDSALDRQLKENGFREKLSRALYGCLGTDFDSPMCAERRQEQILAFFSLAGADLFYEQGIHLEPKFFDAYRNSIRNRYAESAMIRSAQNEAVLVNRGRRVA